MYIPDYYKNENIEEVKTFLLENNFAILISAVGGKSWGTHIPLELEKDLEGNDVLYGHISKLNPQQEHFKNNDEVLAIFSGPNAYVSSSWYKHENVPTWNYIAVHVYGTIKIIEGEELLQAITKLVDKYEKKSKCPVRVQELSAKQMEQINGIVGFKISIKEIHPAYKLSQNRNDEDYHTVIKELESSEDVGSIQVASEMKKRR